MSPTWTKSKSFVKRGLEGFINAAHMGALTLWRKYIENAYFYTDCMKLMGYFKEKWN